MTSWGRLGPVVVGGLIGRRLASPLAVSRLHFRVWPQDMDLNIHMTNSRYLAIMDLGRLDLVVRMGLLGPLLRRGWAPVLSGVRIHYRRPLGPFRRYALESNVVAWAESAIILEHRFLLPGKPGTPEVVAAIAQVRSVFLGRRPAPHKVPAADVMALVGIDTVSPPMPPEWG